MAAVNESDIFDNDAAIESISAWVAGEPITINSFSPSFNLEATPSNSAVFTSTCYS
jgi:hypothetical protein